LHDDRATSHSPIKHLICIGVQSSITEAGKQTKYLPLAVGLSPTRDRMNNKKSALTLDVAWFET